MVRVRLKRYIPERVDEGRGGMFLSALLLLSILLSISLVLGFIKARKLGGRVENAWTALDTAMSRKADIFCMLIEEPLLAGSDAASGAAEACAVYVSETDVRSRIKAAGRIELASREVYSRLLLLEAIPSEGRAARFLVQLQELDRVVQAAAFIYDMQVRLLRSKEARYGRFWLSLSGASAFEPLGLSAGKSPDVLSIASRVDRKT